MTLAAVQAQPISCPVMGNAVAINGPATEFNGVRYQFCCPVCQGAFEKDPAKAINADRNKGKTLGTSLFDPISGGRITKKDSKAWEDYKGVRYFFASEDEKTQFDGDRDKFTTAPAKEAMFCPVEKSDIASPAEALAIKDYNGVRYYLCCGGCPAEFAKEPAKYAPNAASHVKAAKVWTVSQKVLDAEAKAEMGIPAGQRPMAGAQKPQPINFTCKHCGRPMAIKDHADAVVTCNVCGCGRTKVACK